MKAHLLVIAAIFSASLPACYTADGTSQDAGVDVAAAVDATKADVVPPLDVASGAGSCSNLDDGPIARGETGLDMEAEMEACARTLLMGGVSPTDEDFAERVSACVVEMTSLSSTCAACYGAYAECSTAGCVTLCIADPQSVECVDCRCGRTEGKPNCVATLVACTGIPDDRCD